MFETTPLTRYASGGVRIRYDQHPRQRRFRQSRLDLHHRLCMRLRIGRRFAQKHQHISYVLHVSLANLLGLGVFFL